MLLLYVTIETARAEFAYHLRTIYIKKTHTHAAARVAPGIFNFFFYTSPVFVSTYTYNTYAAINTAYIITIPRTLDYILCQLGRCYPRVLGHEPRRSLAKHHTRARAHKYRHRHHRRRNSNNRRRRSYYYYFIYNIAPIF